MIKSSKMTKKYLKLWRICCIINIGRAKITHINNVN